MHWTAPNWRAVNFESMRQDQRKHSDQAEAEADAEEEEEEEIKEVLGKDAPGGKNRAFLKQIGSTTRFLRLFLDRSVS